MLPDTGERSGSTFVIEGSLRELTWSEDRSIDDRPSMMTTTNATFLGWRLGLLSRGERI